MGDKKQQNNQEYEKLLNQADRQAAEGNLEVALEYCRRALRLLPDRFEAWARSGRNLSELSRYSEAEFHLLKALEISPRAVEVLVNLGIVCSEQGRLDRAAKILERACEMHPQDSFAWYNRGVVFKRENNHSEAVKCYLRTLELEPNFVDCYFELADLYRERAELSAAQQVLEHLLIRRLMAGPKRKGDLRFIGGLSAFGRDGPMDDLGSGGGTADAARGDPVVVETLIKLGIIAFENGNYRRAIVYYQTAEHLEPDHPDVHINMGNALDEMGMDDDAVARYRKALEIAPEHEYAYLNLGIFHARRQRLDEARRILESGLEMVPDSALLMAELGEVCASLGDMQQAAIRLEQAAEAGHPGTGHLFSLASVHRYNGDFERSAAVYRSILEQEPESAPAHCDLGSLLLEMEREDDGLAELNRALELDPKLVWAHYYLAGHHFSHEDLDATMAELAQVLEISPGFPMGLYLQACVYAARGRMEEGIETLEQALQTGDVDLRYVQCDPSLDPLKGNQRYLRMMESEHVLEFHRFDAATMARLRELMTQIEEAPPESSHRQAEPGPIVEPCVNGGNPSGEGDLEQVLGNLLSGIERDVEDAEEAWQAGVIENYYFGVTWAPRSARHRLEIRTMWLPPGRPAVFSHRRRIIRHGRDRFCQHEMREEGNQRSGQQ